MHVYRIEVTHQQYSIEMTHQQYSIEMTHQQYSIATCDGMQLSQVPPPASQRWHGCRGQHPALLHTDVVVQQDATPGGEEQPHSSSSNLR